MATVQTRIGHLSQAPVLGASAKPRIKAELFVGRHEAHLGKAVGVTQFGVNHVTLKPGSFSSLRHWHEGEDEFVYVLSGQVMLIDDNGEHALEAGAFVGFPAGSPNAHHFVNKSAKPATLIVVGTRLSGRETIHYPDDDFGPVTVERDATGARLA